MNNSKLLKEFSQFQSEQLKEQQRNNKKFLSLLKLLNLDSKWKYEISIQDGEFYVEFKKGKDNKILIFTEHLNTDLGCIIDIEEEYKEIHCLVSQFKTLPKIVNYIKHYIS